MTLSLVAGLSGYAQSHHPNRFDGIERPYKPDEVDRLRGPISEDYTLARLGAEKLWRDMEEGFVRTLGAITPNQAMQYMKARLKAIYLSGWQIAGDGNEFGMLPDQSLYPADAVPKMIRRMNDVMLQALRIMHSEGKTDITELPAIMADLEACFGGKLNAYVLTLAAIKAGAGAVHIEDQLAAEKKCGHLGGKVLEPMIAFQQKLIAARLAADVAGVPLVIMGRTDALDAKLISNDGDERDREFIDYERGRTPEGFYFLKEGAGLQMVIARMRAMAPYVDVIWYECSRPNVAQAMQVAEAVHTQFPGKKLGYNCSPSFNWRKALSDTEIASFQDEIAALGYCFQFITLAGWHNNNMNSYALADDYRERGMAAFVERVQAPSFAMREKGYTGVEHQGEVGVHWHDLVATTITGGVTATSAAHGATTDQFHG